MIEEYDTRIQATADAVNKAEVILIKIQKLEQDRDYWKGIAESAQRQLKQVEEYFNRPQEEKAVQSRY